ncbi:hypothetical protein KO507_03860 [Gilvimarinus agarilyticus]|uniref:hypothetical protein n=1 Tax=Reichenbachiella agariperforans TaxID=156994 RepID=UPI001C08399E|nr:hypothetical protein [Reichenbachiella agariperforans]MBU2884900.1 hypothetical protein [Gilvimarinus agarilyticus]MBU2914998.1 hypothetical protein [Reichenbachiella agariperforans]
MNDSSLSSSRFFLKKSVIKAERTINRRRGTLTSGKVVAEQSFGFWTSLFEPHHYRLIGGVVIHCFPNKPSSVNRSILFQKLTKVREFRNRIYHNEPICFNGNNVDFSDAQNVKDEMYELLNWIDPHLVKYSDDFDSIDSKIKLANSLKSV